MSDDFKGSCCPKCKSEITLQTPDNLDPKCTDPNSVYRLYCPNCHLSTAANKSYSLVIREWESIKQSIAEKGSTNG